MIGTLNWSARAGNLVLPVSDDTGSISIDDQNVPAITATIVVPRDDSFLALIDPRQTVPPRVQLIGSLSHWHSTPISRLSDYAARHGGTLASLSAAWTGLQVRDVSALFGTPLYQLAPDAPESMSLDLHVRDVSYDDWEMVVSLASDEALLMDWAPTSGQDLIAISDEMGGGDPQKVATWVNPFLSVVLGYTLTPGPYDGSALSDTYTNILDWSRWSSAWDMFRPAIEDTDLKLRVRPSGRGFTLERPENPINSPADHSWLFSDADVISVRHARSRTGDWYDSTLLTTSEMAGGTTVGYPSPGRHSRTYVEIVPDTFKPTLSMAQNIATRSANRGQFIDIVAPIQLGVFMRDEFTYVRVIGEGTPEQWIVKSVTYDFAAGTMNIRGEQRY